MKIKSLFLFMMLAPAMGYCQSVTMPMVGYAEDPTTTITQLEVTKKNTIVTFKHSLNGKGAWVQLNKSMYLQDAKGEDRYNYIKSEGIPLRPARFTSDKDYQEVTFRVYFEKLKRGTKEVNVIERARSMEEQMGGTKFFNYYNVSLTKSGPSKSEHVKVTDVVLMPPPPIGTNGKIMTDSVSTVTGNHVPFGGNNTDVASSFAPMMSSIYTSMLDAQLKMYSKPETTTKLAQVTKAYYDALIKVGFSEEAALKIITSKSLISMDGKQ